MLTVVDNNDDSNETRNAAGAGRSLLDQIVRDGARQMLAAALQAEVADYVARYAGEVDEHGHRLVVRNGYHAEREVVTSAGAVAVKAPRVNDKRIDPDTGERKRFSSAILPAWARKSPQMSEVLPLLYLHGLSSSDFTPALEQFLGGAKAEMFQDMALIKPPRLGREKPWHQDKAYFEYPLGTPVVGTWIALDEATVANGCMQILPGRHREGPIPHFQRRDWQICDNVILGTKSVAVPLQPGGMLFFDGMLPHGTPHNSSPKRRRALQFHYLPAGTKKCTPEERLKAFGGEGKNVTC